VNDFAKRVSSRKFVVAILVLFASTLALYLDLIESVIWRDVVLGTAGIYIAGNVAQKAVAK
jgi:hypothetical protein